MEEGVCVCACVCVLSAVAAQSTHYYTTKIHWLAICAHYPTHWAGASLFKFDFLGVYLLLLPLDVDF